MVRTEKIGKLGEISFILESIKNGFTVLHPEGTHGYDCVLSFGDKFTRVQIKTTSVSERNRYRFNISSISRLSDVFVMHVLGTELFWMYDKSEIPVGSRFQIRHDDINNRHLNNWDIFK